jgi:hypothetical protein
VNGPTPGPERRRFQRYEVNVSLELVVAGRRHRCETVDLGAGGCRVDLPFPLEKGTPAEVHLSSPRTSLVAKGDAVVAWASHAPPLHVGIAFSDPVAEQVIPFMHALLGPVKI